MSDALSDIRKADRNRPRFSQVELESEYQRGYAEGAKAAQVQLR